MHKPRRRLAAAFAAVIVATATSAHAQRSGTSGTYPDRPIRLIVPASPGGTTDGLARIFATRLTEKLGQQVIVDNRASASGVLAGDIVAQSDPDGYTIFLPYHQHTVNAALLPRLPYHPVNSFTPITQLTAAGLMLVVHPSAPVGSMKEFITWTKSTEGLNFGSAGIGSGGHLAGELYKIMSGARAQHIPYKGTGPALAALLGHEYHFNFAGMLGASRMVKAGRLKGLAVTTPTRVPAMPELPTVAESGLPGFEVVGWYGLMAPAKLPQALLAKLHSEFVAVLKEPKVRKIIDDQGAVAVGSTPQEFRRYLLADMEKWQKVVAASGAKAF